MKDPAIGWLIASIAWAALHGPVDYSQSHSLVEALLGVIDIVPLGLVRRKVVQHDMNLFRFRVALYDLGQEVYELGAGVCFIQRQAERGSVVVAMTYSRFGDGRPWTRRRDAITRVGLPATSWQNPNPA